MFAKLFDALPSAQPGEFLHTLYFIVRPLSKKSTFLDFIKSIIYVGIGPFTRGYDHLILTDYYSKLMPVLKRLEISDLKHEEIKKVFDEGQKPLLIRFKTKSRSASFCLENGMIESIGNYFYQLNLLKSI